jgi:hypothetical protein
MPSRPRSTVALVSAAIVIGALAIGACALAALDDAEFRALEKQRGDLSAPAGGIEVVKRAESKAHGVHELHAVRQGAVTA